MDIYVEKYYKYKQKYLHLKKNILKGGSNNNNNYYNNKDVLLLALNTNGLALEYASKELKADREVVLKAVIKTGHALKYASEKLKADRDVLLLALNTNGLALEYASKELKADREVVLKAVINAGHALEYASEELKADREVVLKAVINTGHALEYASEELKADRELALMAIEKLIMYGSTFKFINQGLKDDKKFVLDAIKKNYKFYVVINNELKFDNDIIDNFLEQIKDLSIRSKIFSEVKIINNEKLMLKLIERDSYSFIFLKRGTVLQNIIFTIKALKTKKNGDIIDLLPTEMKNSDIIKYFASLSYNKDKVILSNLNEQVKRVLKETYYNNQYNESNDDIIISYIIDANNTEKEKLYLMIILCSYNPLLLYKFNEYLPSDIKNNDDLLLVYDNYVPSPLRNILVKIQGGGRCYFNAAVQSMICIKEIREIIYKFKNSNATNSLEKIYKQFFSELIKDNTNLKNSSKHDNLFTEYYKIIKSSVQQSNTLEKDLNTSLDIASKYNGLPVYIIEYFFLKLQPINDLFHIINNDQTSKNVPLNKKYILVYENYLELSILKNKENFCLKALILRKGHSLTYVRTIGNNWFLCDDTTIIKLEGQEKIDKIDDPKIHTYREITYGRQAGPPYLKIYENIKI